MDDARIDEALDETFPASDPSAYTVETGTSVGVGPGAGEAAVVKTARAARVHRFGAPDVIVIEAVERPEPRAGEVLVRVAAAGVGPWDALTREGRNATRPSLPLILGSDISGVVEAVGADVPNVAVGDDVFGVTNAQFCGAYTDAAIARASMLTRRPEGLTHRQAASVPVVAVTAWQMLFDYAKLERGGRVLIHGAGGNVGAYAVQLARRAGLHVIATAGGEDLDYVRTLGADLVLDFRTTRFEDSVRDVDGVIDTVGGETRDRSIQVVRRGGVLVTSVSPPTPAPDRPDVRQVFFLVDVTTARLDHLADLFRRGELSTRVGSVLPLASARIAHEMLAGARHARGKIVLDMTMS